MIPGKRSLKYFRKLLEKRSEEIEPDIDGLQDRLMAFKRSLHATEEIPDAFWEKQRAEIFKKIQIPSSAPKYRPAMLWASAAMVVLLCLTVFVEKSKAPIPDFAAGYDQNLLIEVERTLNREYPDALAPGAIFDQEIERNKINRGHTSISK
jgi:hypothetical protein